MMGTTEINLLGAAGLPEFTRTLKELLAETAAAVAPRQSGTDAEGALAAGIAQLGAITAAQADAVVANTQAVLQNTVARATGVQAAASTAGRWMLGLASGGLSPLITGLVRLFTGGDKTDQIEPLIPYSRPASMAFEADAAEAGGITWRRASDAEPMAAQITIQVQAMDSRSFLDHRDEIASAVRQAMLNSHSLNDVMADM